MGKAFNKDAIGVKMNNDCGTLKRDRISAQYKKRSKAKQNEGVQRRNNDRGGRQEKLGVEHVLKKME